MYICITARNVIDDCPPVYKPFNATPRFPTVRGGFGNGNKTSHSQDKNPSYGVQWVAPGIDRFRILVEELEVGLRVELNQSVRAGAIWHRKRRRWFRFEVFMSGLKMNKTPILQTTAKMYRL